MLIPLVAALIALVAALAGYTMVKFFGVIFLGRPREEKLATARDAGRWERLRQFRQFLRLSLQPFLFVTSFLLTRTCHQRGRGCGDFGALLGQTLRGCHFGHGSGGNARYRSINGGESVPSDGTGKRRERGHPAEGEEQLGLDTEDMARCRNFGRLHLRVQLADAARVSLGHTPSNLAPPRERLWRRYSASRSTALMLPSA